MINDIARYSVETQYVMLDCTYQLATRCLNEHYYDEIKAINLKVLANPYVRLGMILLLNIKNLSIVRSITLNNNAVYFSKRTTVNFA